MAGYYSQRATDGVLIIAEATPVSRQGYGYYRGAKDALRRLAGAGHLTGRCTRLRAVRVGDARQVRTPTSTRTAQITQSQISDETR